MNTNIFSFKFRNRFRYSISQLVEFENTPSVVEQKCKTSIILLLGFVIYSIAATILSTQSYVHGKVTNISIALFFSLIAVMIKKSRKHILLGMVASFGLTVILFFHFITEVDWSIGMDAFWLFILILPFITNYLLGVVYGTISAFSGLLLSILLLDTPLNNLLQPYGKNMVEWYSVIYVVVMLAAAVIEYELTSYQIEKQVAEEKLTYYQNERAKRLQETLAIYESNESTIRKYKHDIRHFNRVLAGFIKEQEYEKALEYLKEFDSMLEQVTAVSFCDNQIVNELLTIYAAKCQKLGFKIRVKAIVPERFPIEETELTSLVANALENAFEALEKVDVEKRFLQFELTYNGRKLKLLTKNPCAIDTSFDKNGLPISSRSIQSGIGTAQIKRIAEKHSGVASFSQQNGNFVLKVIMTCM
jgi:hypothetical protein